MAQLLQTTAFLIPLMTAVVAGVPPRAEAAPAKPAAIIEEIQAEGVDFQLLDLVYEDDTIELGASGTMKLAYLRSCIVEEITGGTVTVGRYESTLAGSIPPIRQKVNCDGGGIVPTAEQGEDAGGITFRGETDSTGDGRLVVVRATMPVFIFIEPTKELTIDRIDPGEERMYRFIVIGARLDLANERVRLAAGGHYRATSGSRSVLFLVSRDATETSLSIISRLVGF